MIIRALVFAYIRRDLQVRFIFLRRKFNIKWTHDIFPVSRAISSDHVRSTSLRIRRPLSGMINRRNGNRVYAVRIPIIITLILAVTPIATRKDEHRPLPVPSIVDPVNHCLPNEIVRSLHRHAVVPGAPAAAVDRDVLEAVVERGGFVDGGDGAAEDAHCGGFGLVGDPHTACVVSPRDDLTCASRPVVVERCNRARQGDVVIEIIRILCILRYTYIDSAYFYLQVSNKQHGIELTKASFRSSLSKSSPSSKNDVKIPFPVNPISHTGVVFIICSGW